jgi:hypothetical protein
MSQRASDGRDSPEDGKLFHGMQRRETVQVRPRLPVLEDSLMVDFALLLTLDHLIVRKDGLLCPSCGKTDPVHPGNGTPASAFIAALKSAAERHKKCRGKK